MSAAAGVAPSVPNLNLREDERAFYDRLFSQASRDGDKVTGEVAVQLFEKTTLDSSTLGTIWQIADIGNQGFLTREGFYVALRLVGHAQAGKQPSPELALQPLLRGRLPEFAGIPPPQVQPPIVPQVSGGNHIPPLSAEKGDRYVALFAAQNLHNKLLPGEQARTIFGKSGLPNEILGRIWSLADTEQRGALALPEFIIAMHLITSFKSGDLRTLPNVLPAGLYEVAIRIASAAAPRQSPANTGGITAIPRQLSGSAQQQRTGSPLNRPPMVAAQPTGVAVPNNDWAITPADKARFDQIYLDFDKTNKGYITGEEAAPFLSQSGLPEDILAQIWDLADFHSQGKLTREGFAIAMYLIRQQRSNRGIPLPATLPPNLIPPSLRAQSRPTTAVSSAFDPPPVAAHAAPAAVPVPAPPAPKSALDDLFGLDSSTPSPAPPAPAQTTMSTGGSNADPFAGGSGVLHPASPSAKPSSPVGVTFRPFVPSSSFGRGLAGHPGAEQSRPHTASEDLLGDTDPEASKAISNETTELANLSNQISSLAKQTQEVQAKRTTTQHELSQTNSQKQNFEQRLAQLRQQYEKEAQDTHALEEKLRNSRADTKKLQGECMNLEGQLRDIQGQHQQVLAALQADQQENANLRERIRRANAEVAELKPQLEKLKLDARQQKGLVAINKKQLSTTEGERDKLKAEAEALARSAEDISQSRQLSSSFLPFPEHNESLSSSRQVSPPTSSRAEGSASGSYPFPGGASSGEAEAGAPAATASSEEEEKHDSASATPVPAAQGDSSQKPAEGEAQDRSGSFDNTDHAKAKADFDNAFAAFTSTKAPGSGADKESAAVKPQSAFDNAFDTEFPPISELERDVSESDSETGGFDDDFAPASPENKAKEKQAASEPTPESHKPTTETSDSAAPAPPSQDVTASHEGEAKSAELSSSPATITNNNAIPQTSNADDIFGSSTQPAPGHQNQHPASKGAFDDLDDEFEGLEDAKEGSADDDFANISRSGLDDYNPMFDSSPPASQAKSESTAFGNESSFDFISSNSAASATGQSSNGQQRGAEAHDWDAIFSTLDSPTVPAAQPVQSNNTGPPKEESADTRPPAPGRALTEAGEHDDPILKNLTSMGYSRPDALAALEKYDYNLERAANFLASQS
ncbi:endocytic protein [Trichoderma longibrachiatum ATCC 18648]|uniref:Endocytic protein n=1 Tax=Trichoderma longibrachiatum ATCC 18648 TaxID=983965 RepID=A0A2T4CC60_TRILO|nr:endocytic protein [Trichoderma longibrachiatum ATCC 18648]